MKRNLSTARRLAAGLLALAVAASSTTGATGASAGPLVDLIVRAPGGGSAVAAGAVRAAGGDITFELPIVDGVAASVPAANVSALVDAGFDVAEDQEVRVFGAATGAATSTDRPVALTEIGATELYAAGIDGDPGRTVALIDTGVSTAGIPDLEGRLVPVTDDLKGPLSGPQPCLDLSGEDTCEDTFGHGTFLAGLIAGSGAASGGTYKGVAPGTRILSIKIAGRDGSSDVSKVIAAIQFVVSFKDRYGIRVLNLSLGTDSKQDWRIDPFNYAVERAWDSGIAVVVAAGNLGPAAGTITKPGDDPLVITVGASDDRLTPALSDNRVPNFSGRGARGQGKPDVVAPGTKLVSVLPAGSTIAGFLDAKGSAPIAGGYRKASGTSMAAAVTSGATALLVDAHPEWTPGQLKSALRGTTSKINASDPSLVGTGQIHVARASRVLLPADANVGVTRGDASGALHDSRGTLIVTATCSGLRSYVDPGCGKQIDGSSTAGSGDSGAVRELLGTSWYSTEWNGTSWYTSQWYGTSWYGTSWYGTSWYSTEASQGTTNGSGDTDAEVLGAGPPGSRLYGLWR